MEALRLVNDGIVIIYMTLKGYGFIRSISHSKPIFFHYTQVLEPRSKPLKTGDRVSYDLYQSTRLPDAYEARNIELKP